LNNDVLLEVVDLRKYFPIVSGLFKRRITYVHAVDDVNFNIKRTSTMGLVGESGCGKTTVGRTLLRLLNPTSGKILYNDNGTQVDIAALGKKELRGMRRKMQIVFQDPQSSLNPRRTIHDTLAEPLQILEGIKGEELEIRILELLEDVGLNPEHAQRYPHEFSGGQRQRIGIARAIAVNPELVVLDEPTSSLDVSVQAQVLNLLLNLQKEYKMSYLFISHDLSVIRHMCDALGVMYLGEVVETGNTRDIFQKALHPYTHALLSAIPVPDPSKKSKRLVIKGTVPSAINPPEGCRFHTRCPFAKSICSKEVPKYYKAGEDHLVKCHFQDLDFGQAEVS
jgi:oligopeptide/dipeptide ABC transporter ATP-binding protein